MGTQEPSEAHHHDEPKPSRRYFSTITGEGKRGLRRLADYDLDLIVSTAKVTDDDVASIEAILSLGEVERIVDAGYTVEISDPIERRARPGDVIEFEEWIRGMEEDLGPLKGEENAS